jgi:cell division protein FtsB|tara:strand:- start:761 stop:1180 length:420 start_codon:yes stop_codon:yes gene_type:complete
MLKQVFTSKPMIVIEIVALALFGFNLGKQVMQKRAVDAEVERLEIEIGKLEYKQDDLGNLLKYVQTDEFVEQEARNKLNLVKEGENLVVIPEVDAEPDALLAEEILDDDSQNIKGFVLGDSKIKLWWKYFFDNDTLWLD